MSNFDLKKYLQICMILGFVLSIFSFVIIYIGFSIYSVAGFIVGCLLASTIAAIIYCMKGYYK
jgi:hypothetical protein